MSKIKQTLAMLALASMAMQNGKGQHEIILADTPKKDPPIPKGLKPFKIEGKIVYAINEKNARKKAAKNK